MSAKSLTFAMSQNTLRPPQQLALIMIADGCGEQFTLDDAIVSVAERTSLSMTESAYMIRMLIKKKMIVSLRPDIHYLHITDELLVVNTGAV